MRYLKIPSSSLSSLPSSLYTRLRRHCYIIYPLTLAPELRNFVILKPVNRAGEKILNQVKDLLKERKG